MILNLTDEEADVLKHQSLFIYENCYNPHTNELLLNPSITIYEIEKTWPNKQLLFK